MREFSDTVSVDPKCILDRIKQTLPSPSRFQNLRLHADAPYLAQKAKNRWIYITSPYENRANLYLPSLHMINFSEPRACIPTLRIKIVSLTGGLVVSDLCPPRAWEELKTAENHTEFCFHIQQIGYGSGCVICCTESNQYIAAVFKHDIDQGDAIYSYDIVDITQDNYPTDQFHTPSSEYQTEKSQRVHNLWCTIHL